PDRLNAGDVRLIAMGRLSPEKGFDLLIRAVALLRRQHPGCSLTILGDGPEREPLEGLAEELGVAEAVSFGGQVRDPAAHLVRGDIFVLPSRFEGFPNALLEAMACGLAVVAADCPSGPRQLV